MASVIFTPERGSSSVHRYGATVSPLGAGLKRKPQLTTAQLTTIEPVGRDSRMPRGTDQRLPAPQRSGF